MSLIKHSFDPSRHELFTPKNTKKYIGKYPIIARSGWERTFMRWLDSNPGIIAWTSEGIEVPYFDPVRNKQRRYYPDFVMKTIGNDNKELTYLVEIKPYKEVMAPTLSKGKSQKTRLYEASTYATNSAKWRAASEFCKRRNWIFKIITEKELYK